MAKIITDGELAELITKIINDSDARDDADTYSIFIDTLANAIGFVLGGEASEAAAPEEDLPHWTVAFTNKAELDISDLWDKFDPEGEM